MPSAADQVAAARYVPSVISAAAAGTARSTVPARRRPAPGSGDSSPKATGTNSV
ncbi:hypothetical protein [Streptomyces sp. MMS20-AI2-20]|uniref:hypothetical protein n=1 Tax=Streptomyces sp. MMS20-AI2-20 TaxID=2925835 RepID=UPI001F603BFA|nr:hypothetical protein [Streptomyces sp. MMS20-AI2-20]MCI4145422.1 hypothetical protein [Streptomyces sp. MMS20-AI2-20]